MGNPTAEDIDNYHRLCVEYGTVINAAQISSLFKENEFDYMKTKNELECMLQTGDYYPVPKDSDGSDFCEEDQEAYEDGDGSGDYMEFMVEAATAAAGDMETKSVAAMAFEYICTGKVCGQMVMPEQLSVIENASIVKSLPGQEGLCMNWLMTGFCCDEKCEYLHTLYGVKCKHEQGCENAICPFVHTTIMNQYTRVRDKLGMSLRRPDDPQDDDSIMAADQAIQDSPIPSRDELRAAFPHRILPPSLTEQSAGVPQDEKEQEDLKKKITDMDLNAGREFEVIDGENKIEDESSFQAPKQIWSSQIPFLEKYRAFNNEQEIHIRMRLLHLHAALACPPYAKAEREQHLTKALFHFNRERYLSLQLDRYNLLMANAHYAVFDETNERVLYLYTLSVCEARDLLIKLFKDQPRKERTYFVFGRTSRREGSTDVILDDVRKFCAANGVTVVSGHDDVLQLRY